MKTYFGIALLLLSSASAAQVHVNGYVKKDGTYVAPHQRSAPNSTTLDNYSTKGNVNPYTGAPGTKNPDPYDSPQVTPSRTIYPTEQPRSTYDSQRAQPSANPYNPAPRPSSRF